MLFPYHSPSAAAVDRSLSLLSHLTSVPERVNPSLCSQGESPAQTDCSGGNGHRGALIEAAAAAVGGVRHVQLAVGDRVCLSASASRWASHTSICFLWAKRPTQTLTDKLRQLLLSQSVAFSSFPHHHHQQQLLDTSFFGLRKAQKAKKSEWNRCEEKGQSLVSVPGSLWPLWAFPGGVSGPLISWLSVKSL